MWRGSKRSKVEVVVSKEEEEVLHMVAETEEIPWNTLDRTFNISIEV
jgi:hypothetical protein